jgi:release factor glutamine methyltransferase
MNLETVRSGYREKLAAVMSTEEAEAVTSRVFEEVLGLRRIDLVMNKELPVAPELQVRLEQVLLRLLSSEPVQYVLESAPFYGREFFVSPAVLIPRPETEELVRWMLESVKDASYGRLIDFGTGSGCIPVTFAVERPDWEVMAVDISPAALAVAEKNARKFSASVSFRQLDLLAYDSASSWPPAFFKVIVSNPPYIPESEADLLDDRVRKYEPGLALFTPEEDPLLFYRALQRLASVLLAPGGELFLEVHERYARETLRLFNDESFVGAELRNDIFGKPRMIRVRKPAS